jgi:transaldolase
MKKPSGLNTKIFLDSGDPVQTQETIDILGFLDGQTTNPTLISKNPDAVRRLEKGEKFTKEEIYDFYKEVVEKISGLIPQGSISVEVYSDKNTTADEMFSQGKEMLSWIPNAHIKYPTTKEGLRAAERSVGEGMRVNMTLCFSQQQAAAVYAATKGAKKGDVFISPFIGRLDDIGENGMDLIKNIIEMYKNGDGHVEVLAASIRNMDHLFYCLKLKSDIITSPFKILKEWGDKGLTVSDERYSYETDLKEIPYHELDLSKNWEEFNINHELTDKGLDLFSKDWNKLIKTLFS